MGKRPPFSAAADGPRVNEFPPYDHPPDPEADSQPPGGRRTKAVYLAVLLAVLLVMDMESEWSAEVRQAREEVTR